MRWLHRLNRRFLLRYRMEYGVLLVIVFTARSLSPSFAWRTARWVGRLMFRLGVRRKTMLRNLAIAFPDWSEERRLEVARKSLEHFACLVVDVLFQNRMLNERNVLDRVRATGWAEEYLAEHGREGLRERARRLLFLTAHLGNWELASGFFSLLGVSIAPVYRATANPFVDRLIRELRLDRTSEVIERRGAVQRMLELFEQGGNIGFLFDQNAVRGIWVPFFGQPSCTHKTPAVLVRDYRVRVFFGVMVRRGDFLRYEARGRLIDFEPSGKPKAEELKDIITHLNELLEAEIRQDPEQYFWMHRRWKRTGFFAAIPPEEIESAGTGAEKSDA